MKRRRNNILLITLGLALLVAIGFMFEPAFAGNSGSAPRRVDVMALAADEVKQLLLLMDTNENGKISKEEFMRFVEAEFDRLDADKSGQLDPKELTRSQLRASHFSHAGK